MNAPILFIVTDRCISPLRLSRPEIEKGFSPPLKSVSIINWPGAEGISVLNVNVLTSRITSYNVCYTKLLRLGNVEGWRYIVPPLSEDYRVVAFDRPAFGLTERPPVNGQNNPYTPEEAEKITLGLIESLGLGKPILIGHSAGGNLALRLALHYPDRFSGLILISPGVYTEIPPALVRDLMELGVLKESGLELIRSIPEHIRNNFV